MTKPSLPAPVVHLDMTHVQVGGRRLDYYGGCDYFRLSWHPEVRQAVRRGLKEWGLNVSASRRTTGNHPLYGQLERALASFFGAPDAVLLSNGYLTAMAVAQAFIGNFTHVLLDERAHACLVDAASSLHVPVRVFAHVNLPELRRCVRRLPKGARPLLMTDGLFAHNGAVAPLREYRQTLPRHGWMLVDDAHGAGTVGKKGRGSLEFAGLDRRQTVQTITLSKAWGVYGGAILGPTRLCRQVWAQSRIATGNTPLPLPLAAAALRATAILQQHPEWRRQLYQHRQYLCEILNQAGANLPDLPGPIVGWTPPSRTAASLVARALLRAGILPPLIHYPGAPTQGFFRFALSHRHSRAQLDHLASVLVRCHDFASH